MSSPSKSESVAQVPRLTPELWELIDIACDANYRMAQASEPGAAEIECIVVDVAVAIRNLAEGIEAYGKQVAKA